MHFYNGNNLNKSIRVVARGVLGGCHDEQVGEQDSSRLQEENNNAHVHHQYHIGGKGRLLLQVTECVIDTYHAVVDTCTRPKQQQQQQQLNAAFKETSSSLQDKIQDLEEDNKDLVSILRETQKQLAEALEAKAALQNELKQVMAAHVVEAHDHHHHHHTRSHQPPSSLNSHSSGSRTTTTVPEVIAEPVFQPQQAQYMPPQGPSQPQASSSHLLNTAQQHCCAETVCYDTDYEEPQWLFLDDEEEPTVEPKQQQQQQPPPLPRAAHDDEQITVLAMDLLVTPCTTIQPLQFAPTSTAATTSTVLQEAYVVQVIHEDEEDSHYDDRASQAEKKKEDSKTAIGACTVNR
eukprot:CAMPEP_0117085890 /NCGR_PEP_ID=MMETSP0472-20121206/60332_1 /TAXON_ID=693140 ORGANISM="Tiarina fusus, Strain LIS" /NCGR_SAMPLE_ID=MMETSP0472 /ASSEMBLY_ACC=CAM_ASM_000603 /LENGTH=347 /DNA_ID=CAMNT_0004815235 /DNA_START=601 /DNA_END=1644 /DNA_ORIENTATION=-